MDIINLKAWPLTSHTEAMVYANIQWNLAMLSKTRGTKGHISCTWVQCATFLTDQPGGDFCLLINLKNINLVEDIEILLPVRFHWLLFSGLREEAENVSANQTPGRPSCFSDRPEKHKLGRGRWNLASCQVSLNSVQRFQRRNRNCLSQSDARAAILFFGSAWKTQTWDLASWQVWLNTIQQFQWRSRKYLSQSEARAAIFFSQTARKTQTWWKTFRSCFLSSFVESCSAVSEKKSNMSQPIRGQSGHLFFADQPEKLKLCRGHWDLASCQVALNSVQRIQRRSRKNCFSDRPEN